MKKSKSTEVKSRLRLRVDQTGAAHIDFLNAAGQVKKTIGE